jgi:hypothetical protein
VYAWDTKDGITMKGTQGFNNSLSASKILPVLHGEKFLPKPGVFLIFICNV